MDISSTLQAVNNAWKRATKIILGEEIGDIWAYENYLKRYTRLPKNIQSPTNENIYLPSERYKSVKKVMPYTTKIKMDKPFANINEIKDIDNLFELARDHFEYIGNVILGNSKFIEKSANIVDSFYVYNSNTIAKSKYVAYSSYAKDVEYTFGSHALGSMKFIIATNVSGGGDPIARIFESFYILGGTYDAYFSHNLSGCSEAFFSFFQKGKSYIIGNNQLSKDKYLKIKEGLLEQVRTDLERGKLKTLYEIIKESKNRYHVDVVPLSEPPPEKVREAFSSVTNTILGKELDIENRHIIKFLTRNLPYYHIDAVKANGYMDVVGGLEYYLGRVGKDLVRHVIPTQMMNESEKIRINLKEPITLDSLVKEFNSSGLALINISFGSGNLNTIESAPAFHSANIYRVIDGVMAKTSAYSLWPRESTNTFGSFSVFESHGVIRSYGSEKVMRVFESDSSNNISDSYYVHMCEGITNAMFSFGLRGSAKGMGRGYILNTSLDLVLYNKVKENLKEWIVGKVEGGKQVPHVFELQASL